MDWTGGTRKRFAAGKTNATVQRQKAHFAKARAALQGTPTSKHSFRQDNRQDDIRHGTSSVVKSRVQSSSHSMRGIGRQQARSHDIAIAYNGEERGRKSSVSRNVPSDERQSRMPVSPGIVSISSKDASSRAASSANHDEAEKLSLKALHDARPETSNITDEDKFLFANRRRLLARTDWLGLGARRPVKMKFAASSDKARIGKRRRILKPTPRKGRPAEKLSVSPLFGNAVYRNDHMMSGAIAGEDIQIRVGTDALASQTQRSHHSHTPANTSMRHPSTEFGPLSEESMLLDADDNRFDMGAVTLPGTKTPPSAVEPDADSLAVLNDSRNPKPTQHYGHDFEEVLPTRASPTGHQYETSDNRANIGHSRGLMDFVPDSEPAQHHDLVPVRGQTGYEGALLHQLGSDVEACLAQARAGHVSVANMKGTEEEEEDDDKMWRGIMNIGKADSSHDSMIALNSASQHYTTSDSSQRRNITIPEAPRDPNYRFSIPQGAGTQQSPLDRTQRELYQESSSRFSTATHSPSASLRKIMKLAEQPAPPDLRAQEEADDNALWRDFIVGSQDSSDQSPQGIRSARHDDDDGQDTVRPTQGSSTFNVSDLGTSNRSTLGDTLFVTGSTPSAMSTTLAKRRKELSSEHDQNLNTSHSSMVVQAKTGKDGIESISDVPSPAMRKRTSDNIHGHQTSVLNPKRFKPSSKRSAPPRARQHTVLPSRKARKDASNRLQSIYDLVNSDGLSVA